MLNYDRKFVIWELTITTIIFTLGLGIGWVIWGGRCEPPVILNYYNFNDLVVGEVKPIIIPVETITATITAYSSTPEETDSTPFITASGKETRNGIVACPRKYPFGTIVKIDDEWYICEDRLSLKYDNRWDIWTESKEEAIEFGRQIKQIILYQ